VGCKLVDLAPDIVVLIQPLQQLVHVLLVMFGDFLEKGLLQVRGQELHDVRDQGLVVELAEGPVGQQA
jgi:hypothetical protein